ncbi:THOC3 isoform 9, partial [Pan troglodytes]
VSLWDVDELVCVRCFSRLDWPVRTLSFSHDGKMLASASEDHFIDIAEVETDRVSFCHPDWCAVVQAILLPQPPK